MHSVQLEMIECPVCHYELDAATLLSQGPERDVSPRDGDFTICAKCGMILRFATVRDQFKFVIATPDSLEEMKEDNLGLYEQMIQVSFAVKNGLFKNKISQ